jgi:hypothetical protein
VKHGLGYKPDTAHKRGRAKLSHELLGEAPSFPPADSYESLEGPILDQNQTGSCTGHGTSQALQIACAKASLSLGFRPSPRGIYDNARLVEESVLTDGGAMPADVISSIASKGVRALVEPSPEGFATDVDPSNVNVPPTAEELAAESKTLVPGEYRVDNAQDSFIAQLCAGIHQCGSAGIGVFVDTGFENYTPETGPVSSVDLNDPNGGGHWLCVSSYRTGADGKMIFRGPNSWGMGWGDNGHFEVTEDFLKAACSDCYVFAVSLAAGA